MAYRCLLKSVIIFFIATATTGLFAQVVKPGATNNGSATNAIPTGVPFLLITPDARAGGMGNAGVAVQPDANAMSINPAKLAFMEKPQGLAVSYSPWLRSMVSDMNLGFLSGYYMLDNTNTIAASLRYFSFGETQFVDVNQQDLGVYNPNELAFDLTYAKRFGNTFSLATSLRYIYSNLASGHSVQGQQTRAGTALAVDVSAYYKTEKILLGTDAIVSVGANISNIGTKIVYTNVGNKAFLPTNFKLGGATSLLIDDYSIFTFALDLNKLLVPSLPVYGLEGNIISGRDPDRSVPAGILGSFMDAPGGISEELKEVSIAAGIEYRYNEQFAFRAGYFYENPMKGNQRYFTLGAGLRYSMFDIDFSYLLANAKKSPLANTLRFGLLFNFGDTPWKNGALMSSN